MLTSRLENDDSEKRKRKQEVEMELEKTKNNLVGELRFSEERLSMCVLSNATFGGGKGDFWIIKDGRYICWLNHTLDYSVVICRDFSPMRKTVRFEFEHCNTWGKYAGGTCVDVPCSDINSISHYHPHGVLTLVKESQIKSGLHLAQVAFAKHSLKELEQALISDHEEHMAELIGEKIFFNVKRLINQYMTLCKEVNAGGKSAYRVPSTQKSEAKHNFLRLLKQINFGEQA